MGKFIADAIIKKLILADKVVKKANVVILGITCLLYTSDAADDLLCVDLGSRRIIKKKNNQHTHAVHYT